MQNGSPNEVLATVAASPGRRVLGILAIALLGVLVLYVAFARPPTLVWQVFLLVLGAGALWLANAMRVATQGVVELTETELREQGGEIIVRIEDITSIDRGAFAFKPSNGFLVRMRASAPRAWRPGLWWRVGRRIGIGGMTPGNESKFMAEIIAVLLAQRGSGS